MDPTWGRLVVGSGDRVGMCARIEDDPVLDMELIQAGIEFLKDIFCIVQRARLVDGDVDILRPECLNEGYEVVIPVLD